MAKVITTNSIIMSHNPRLIKNKLSCFFVRRVLAILIDTPLKKTNSAAQKWVIHRVKNSIGVVVAKSPGLGLNAWKKSRVWSSAMISMINPRKMSMDWMRYFVLGMAIEVKAYWV